MSEVHGESMLARSDGQEAVLLTPTVGARAVQKPLSLSLRQNFSWTFIGNVFYAACQWGMLMVLAKMGSPEIVGQYSLGLAIAAPVFMFTNLQLRGVQATDASREFSFEDYRCVRLAASSAGLILITAIIVFYDQSLQTSLVILLVGVAKAIESISDIYYGFLQQRERMDRIAKSMVLKGIVSLGVMASILWLTDSIVLAVTGVALSWLIILGTYDLRSLSIISREDLPDRNRGKMLDVSKARALILVSLPLGLVMLLISLNVNIPRYFIESALGERALGFFAALSYLIVAGRTVVTALGQAASPRLAKLYASRDFHAFSFLMWKLIAVAVLLGIGGVVVSSFAGKQILSFLYTPEYAAYKNIFVWMTVVAGVSYVGSFLGYGMTAARRFHIQLPLFSIATLATLVVSYFFVPKWGMEGGVLALAAGAVVQVIGSGLVNWNMLRPSIIVPIEANSTKHR